MQGYYIVGCVAGISAAAIAVSYAVISRKRNKEKIIKLEKMEEETAESAVRPLQETDEEQFVKAWTDALNDSARTFNGLYQGLQRIVDGKAKKPERVLREWCARARYKWEDQPASELCEMLIVPLFDNADQAALAKWSGLLLQAASLAGIIRGTTGKISLDESNVNDYTEWEGEPLYVEDEVEVMFPAWYQRGSLLEQGTCRKEESV